MRRDEALKPKKPEIQMKILPESTPCRVVTVAKHCLALKMLPIMHKLVLYIRKLCVKLIVLRLFSSVKITISCHLVLRFQLVILFMPILARSPVNCNHFLINSYQINDSLLELREAALSAFCLLPYLPYLETPKATI